MARICSEGLGGRGATTLQELDFLRLPAVLYCHHRKHGHARRSPEGSRLQDCLRWSELVLQERPREAVDGYMAWLTSWYH